MHKFLLCSLLLLLSACDTSLSSSSNSDLILDSDHGGGGAAWGLADCDACHAVSVIHKDAHGIRDIAKQHGYDSCTGCHGNNGTAEPRQCLICHNKTDLPEKPALTSSHKHDFAATADLTLQDKQCIDCHFAADMDGIFEINRDLSRYPDANGINSPYSSGADFCLRCHNRDHQQSGFSITGKEFDDPLIAIEDTYTLVDKHGKVDASGSGTYAGLRSDYSYGSRVECSDCHAMHGTENAKLLIDRSDIGSSKLDPAIRYLPHSVSIGGENYSQLCVLCHDMQTLQDQGDMDTGNGLSGVHLTGTSCIECHSHGEAVQAGM